MKEFKFRGLHPFVLLGTASDRYAGWIGQIYSDNRYAGRIARRQEIVAKQSFTEGVLPVESVEEYFTHFRGLELDVTFNRPLLAEDGSVTQDYHTIRTYRQYLNHTFRN